MDNLQSIHEQLAAINKWQTEIAAPTLGRIEANQKTLTDDHRSIKAEVELLKSRHWKETGVIGTCAALAGMFGGYLLKKLGLV